MRLLRRQTLASCLAFALWLLPGGPARALDLLTYEAYRGEQFIQSAGASPTLDTNAPYFFEAVANPVIFIFVTNPVVEIPSGAMHPLEVTARTNGATYVTNFTFTGTAASSNALVSAYGNGKYILTYTGHDDGPASNEITFQTGTFPPTPVVSNLVAAQSINYASNFTLNFTARPASTTNAFVQLLVMDNTGNTIFSTPAPDQYPEKALSGSNSLINIGPGYLLPGETYTGLLVFTRTFTNTALHLTGYPIVLAGFISQTLFTLQTTGGAPPPQPPTPAPAVLTDTLLTFTVTNGTGSFALGNSYELFTSPTGTNYTILGDAGGSFASGGYAYVRTGTNTGDAILTDAKAGVLILQMTFSASGIGSFSLNSSGGMEKGTFIAAPSNANFPTPNLFLPSWTNGQFQTYISGSVGLECAVETSTDLTHWAAWTNVTLQDLSTDITDAASSGNRFYRVSARGAAFAPGSITGQSFSCTISSGAAPLTNSGAFQWAAEEGDTYQILDVSGSTNGAGTYTYLVTSPTTATISYKDSTSGEAYDEQLVFTAMGTGYFYTTNAGLGGFETGSFNMATGPVYFPGNVRFNPDTTRGVSGVYPADGTPFTLSATDAAGFVWTLNMPGDALLTTATISMTPFTAIDSSQAALPIVSGVQLGPDGMEFCDGVTLTMTAPSALGSHATLLMANSDGSGLYLVDTTNNAETYATTLLHFSSAGASNPSDAQWQKYKDENLPQAEEAYNEALSQMQALEQVVVQPPEPPDDKFTCSGSGAGDGALDPYVKSLFAKETAAIHALVSAAQTVAAMTADSSYRDQAAVEIKRLIETSGFRKATALLNDYGTDALKFPAVAKAALNVSSQDQIAGGAGLPNVGEQLVALLSNNVLDYYWKQLLNQHDYSMANVLIKLEGQISLFGGVIHQEQFLQEVASGYTFQVTMTAADVGDQLSIKTHGMVKVTGNSIEIAPIGGITQNFTYDSGTFDNCNVDLPLEFDQGAFFVIPCETDYSTLDIFVYNDMASLNENWSCPESGGPYDILGLDFDQAFTASHGTQNVVVDYDCNYYFTVPWQNMQAEPANATFTGPGEFVLNDMVTFTIDVQHMPQEAPQTLIP